MRKGTMLLILMLGTKKIWTDQNKKLPLVSHCVPFSNL